MGPYYQACPRCRDARAYAWARSRLQCPESFAADLALFPTMDPTASLPVGLANLQLLRAQGQPSLVTRKFMVAEATDTWEKHAENWLREIVRRCLRLGIEPHLPALRESVERALKTMAQSVPTEGDPGYQPDVDPTNPRGHGFDKTLLDLEGWSQDPGTIVFPVDDFRHALSQELLLLSLRGVAFLKGSKIVRTAEWSQVTLIYLFEEAVTFDIQNEPLLTIAGFKDPEKVLETARTYYRSATERMLQALATDVIHVTP